MLFGETAPRGTRARRRAARVPARRAVPRLAVPPRGHCARSTADGYAHHAYTTRVGPRFRPPDRDDVTIGVLSRLTHALDRAGRAGAIRRGLGIYLTEFGIQSTPDPFVGVSLARQAEYLAIAEHDRLRQPAREVVLAVPAATTTSRARAGASTRYGGFESGLRRSDGRAKPAYDAFRLPLAVETYGRSDVLWGRVRPLTARTQVAILRLAAQGPQLPHAAHAHDQSPRRLRACARMHRKRQRYRVRWTAPDGKVWLGPPIRP